MLSLRAMLHLELPHINVLSKIDLIQQYGDLGECPRLHAFPALLRCRLYIPSFFLFISTLPERNVRAPSAAVLTLSPQTSISTSTPRSRIYPI